MARTCSHSVTSRQEKGRRIRVSARATYYRHSKVGGLDAADFMHSYHCRVQGEKPYCQQAKIFRSVSPAIHHTDDVIPASVRSGRAPAAQKSAKDCAPATRRAVAV